jgi:hypothetical protein
MLPLNINVTLHSEYEQVHFHILILTQFILNNVNVN